MAQCLKILVDNTIASHDTLPSVFLTEFHFFFFRCLPFSPTAQVSQGQGPIPSPKRGSEWGMVASSPPLVTGSELGLIQSVCSKFLP